MASTLFSSSVQLPPLWTYADIQELVASRDFEHMGQITLGVLKRSPCPVTMVSGPISTGGSGSRAENLARYHRAMEFLGLFQDRKVFNQLPSEEAVIRHYNAWRQGLVGLELEPAAPTKVGAFHLQKDEDPYCWELLEGIYAPLFRSGKVGFLMFMPNWKTSRGSKWEHDMACHLGIPIGYMASNWEDRWNLAA